MKTLPLKISAPSTRFIFFKPNESNKSAPENIPNTGNALQQLRSQLEQGTGGNVTFKPNSNKPNPPAEILPMDPNEVATPVILPSFETDSAGVDADQNQTSPEAAPEADPQMQEIFDYVVDLFENNSDFSSLEPEHSSPFYVNSISKKLYFASKPQYSKLNITDKQIFESDPFRTKWNALDFDNKEIVVARLNEYYNQKSADKTPQTNATQIESAPPAKPAAESNSSENLPASAPEVAPVNLDQAFDSIMKMLADNPIYASNSSRPFFMTLDGEIKFDRAALVNVDIEVNPSFSIQDLNHLMVRLNNFWEKNVVPHISAPNLTYNQEQYLANLLISSAPKTADGTEIQFSMKKLPNSTRVIFARLSKSKRERIITMANYFLKNNPAAK